MHFNFDFTATQIVWTLTFAAILVLLVVLLGRERVRRFPIFTTSIVLVGLNMLAHRLLADRLAPLPSSEMFLALADAGVFVSLLLVIELARRAFNQAKWPAWVTGVVALLAGATAVIKWWGEWPPASVVFEQSTLGHLRFMQLVAQKGDLFNDVLALELFVLVVIFGRRFKAGWRSHTQQILLGLSTTSVTLIVMQVMWQTLRRNMPHTQAGYDHLMNVQDRLVNANSTVALVVMIWWIACLWIDEPGAAARHGVVVTTADGKIVAATDKPEIEPPSEPSDNAATTS